jgi:xanthine dehydrogenase accessory factor
VTAEALLGREAELRGDRIPFVRAIVVAAERPTSAKPGDQALMLADGTIEGFVGGSCVESHLRTHGLLALESATATLLRVSPEPGDDRQGRVNVINSCSSGGTLEIFLEPVLPTPIVAVHGTSPIAMALLAVGRSLEYQMMGADPARIAEADALVVASHGQGEEEILEAALTHGVPYVALVASRRRGQEVVASLRVSPQLAAQVHTPAGLDIRARGPHEVAVAILAEIISLRPRGQGEAQVVSPALAIDPICGMEVAAVATSLQLDHLGHTYYFCGPGCLKAFSANPPAADPA